MSQLLDFNKSIRGTSSSGIAYLSNVDISKTKAPSSFTFQLGKNKWKAISFNVAFVNLAVAGKIYEVKISHGEYNGNDQFTLDAMVEYVGDGTITADRFLPSLDVESIRKELFSVIGEYLPPNFQQVIFVLMTHTEIKKRVVASYAAKGMHDAIRGGLLNHKRKMLNLGVTLVKNDERLKPFANLILTGIVIHDLGKAIELNESGNYHQGSMLGHRTILVGIMYEMKSILLEQITLREFEMLISVVVGHHGKYEDPPVSMVADIVHLVDMLDAKTTNYMDTIESGDKIIKNGEAQTIWSRDYERIMYIT